MELSFISVGLRNAGMYYRMKSDFIRQYIPLAEEIGIKDIVAENYSPQQAKKNFCDRKDMTVDYISIDKKMVGFIEYSRKFSEHVNEDVCFIDGLYLLDDFRGNGIGKRVINLFLDRHGLLELTCHYSNKAHDFYEKLGFKREYTQYFLKESRCARCGNKIVKCANCQKQERKDCPACACENCWTIDLQN
ncbi:GNAT family N-acetyltransferase [Enterococcus sp. LJL128]